ncbi:BON domain-containing protein [Catenuloplanes indicus]|uniref:BON domain-containing protein n=1 Tax=Catenuloplanes indicus TaxID=137267 RepID=A0AAE3VXL8_9ACTN|nr:BON domain-containing protein [Catenuloplanes indicus]MDQ0365167.1 hypothetical protein [Catenuloplanes indicus]
MATPLPHDREGSGVPGPRRISGLDARLTYQVAHNLLVDDRTRRERIVVSVRDGVAILSGRAGAEAREVAGGIALGSDGVRDVCNRIDAPDTGVRLERQRFDTIVAGLVAEASRWDRPPPAVLRTPSADSGGPGGDRVLVAAGRRGGGRLVRSAVVGDDRPGRGCPAA